VQGIYRGKLGELSVQAKLLCKRGEGSRVQERSEQGAGIDVRILEIKDFH
jgi:hypothetical protein